VHFVADRVYPAVERHEEERHDDEDSEEDERDPNKVEWEENDPENPQKYVTVEQFCTAK